MAAGSQQSVFEFLCKCVNSSLEELLKIKVIFILRKGMLRYQNLQKSLNVLNPHKSFAGRRLTPATRKSMDIQASLIANRRTLSKRRFV